MKPSMSPQDVNHSNPLALILGGAGAVGSYLCDSLLSQSCQVICFDEFNDLKVNNITHLVGGRNFKVLDKIDQVKEEVDYVFCLDKKWYDSLNLFINSRWLFLASEFDDNVFDQAQKLAINCRFVCADGFFGPRMDLDYPSWTAKLVSDIFFRRRIRLAGDGSAPAYPLFVKDLVTGLTASLFMPQSQGQVFYFAGEEITLFSFAKLWSDHVVDLKIEFDERKTPPQVNYQRELALSRQELGWKINFSHPEAVSITMDWLNRPDVSQLLSGQKLPFKKKTVSSPLSSWSQDQPDRLSDQKTGSGMETEKIDINPLGKTVAKKSSVKDKTDSEGLWLSREPDSKNRADAPFDGSILEIKHLLSEEKAVDGLGLSSENNHQVARPKDINKFWLWVSLFSLFFLVLFSPVLFLTKDLLLAVNSLNRSQETCLAGQLVDCQKQARQAQEYFYRAQNTTNRLMPVLAPLFGQESFSQAAKTLSLGQEAASALDYFSDSAQGLEQVFQAIILPQEEMVDVVSLLKIGQQLTQRAYFKLTNVAATSKNLPKPITDKTLKQLPAAIEGTKMTLDLLPFLADFLTRENQRIILLLQNNMELRPTGGFIGSFGLMDFESGQLVNFTVKDVYEADGQLKGQVEPPETLKKYLGEESWYLRDANWSPDFTQTAQQILWFWEKQLDQRADGVIAINLQVVEKILFSLGGVYLPDYQETITAQNLFERAEYHSEIGFFPGSTQKKDFLGSLAFEILETIKRQENLSVLLFSACQQSLLEGEVAAYFSDPGLEKQIVALGFDGGIKEVVCQKDSCLSDYLWSVDTNVGANKANFFVKKKLVQRLGISNEQVSHSLRLTWQNTAQTQSWPAGPYKNYWRLYLPSRAVLQEAFLENNAGQRQAIEPEVTQEMGKKVWNYLIEVPINSQVTVEINYQIKKQFDEDRKRLVYLVQKQAGTGWEEDVTLISYPVDWLPLFVSPDSGDISGGAITYRNILDRDRLFEFEWGEP
ncbi:MAG: DUF4012 domain-containing protein [Candidatus Shapirobacteria bacterium]|nr:DUF4012 domain-containing protein [Candidatus Shapirobacteria bacterium]